MLPASAPRSSPAPPAGGDRWGSGAPSTPGRQRRTRRRLRFFVCVVPGCGGRGRRRAAPRQNLPLRCAIREPPRGPGGRRPPSSWSVRWTWAWRGAAPRRFGLRCWRQAPRLAGKPQARARSERQPRPVRTCCGLGRAPVVVGLQMPPLLLSSGSPAVLSCPVQPAWQRGQGAPPQRLEAAPRSGGRRWSGCASSRASCPARTSRPWSGRVPTPRRGGAALEVYIQSAGHAWRSWRLSLRVARKTLAGVLTNLLPRQSVELVAAAAAEDNEGGGLLCALSSNGPTP